VAHVAYLLTGQMKDGLEADAEMSDFERVAVFNTL